MGWKQDTKEEMAYGLEKSQTCKGVDIDVCIQNGQT